MITTTTQPILSVQEQELLKTLLYFDVFRYPLTVKELYENAAIHASYEEYQEMIHNLVESGHILRYDDFLLTPEMSYECITRRQKGNRMANQMLPVAHAYSRRIARFPFVEAVCLSGGLSKNFYDEKSDIDYFIITKPNRLWICRTLLIIYYKLLPESKKKFWCVNYFISSDKLNIPDKNHFVSTEIAFLIPTVNHSIYHSLMKENSWHKEDFPNKEHYSAENCHHYQSSFFKRSAEWILNGRLGNYLDDSLLKFTLNKWRKKYPFMNDEAFEIQFRSKKNACKRHVYGYQNRVLLLWEEKIKNFEQKRGISLNVSSTF